MTPNVRAASRLVSDPTTAMWFDVGQMPEYSGECPVDVDMLMRPPFDRCAICGLDADGDLFVIAVTGGRENVLGIAGLTRTQRGIVEMGAFNVIRQPDGKVGLHNANDRTQALRAVVMVMEWLSRMAKSSSEAYQPTVSEHPINRSRAVKGKKPLSFAWRTVVVAPTKPPSEARGGTHASPRLHDRRGHWRTLKASGKRVWVRDCKVGDASKGAIFKDYNVSPSAREGQA